MKCEKCNGTGQHQVYDSKHVTSCNECDGDGSYHNASVSKMICCPKCDGTGEIDAAITYKVWLHVEEIDEANDSYLDDFEGSRLPISVGEYSTPVEAYELVDEITDKYL